METKLFDLDGRTRRAAVAAYWIARYRSKNFCAKRELTGDPAHTARQAVYAEKNKTAIEALRAGIARVGIDQTCDPGMLSVRIAGERVGHLPACELPDDLHAAILKDLSDEGLEFAA